MAWTSPPVPDMVLQGQPVPGPDNFVMPRGALATDLGERLRQAGLNEGVSFGGSEIQYRPDVSAGQRAAVEGIATQPPAPAAISNADIARFLAIQNGGNLPGMPEPGGGGNITPGQFTSPQAPESVTQEAGPSVTGGTGNISDLSNPPTAETVGGRGALAQAVDALAGGLNSPVGQAVLSAAGAVPFAGMPVAGARLAGQGLGLLGFGPRANPDVTGNRAEQQAFENAPNQFVGTDPQALAAQRSGERAPDLSPVGLGREDLSPNPEEGAAPSDTGNAAADAATAAATTEGVSEGTSSGGVSGSTGSEGGASGTGGGPGDAGSGDGGGGDGGDGGYRRGGRVGRRSAGGSFKGAKKFSGGGAVPMTRAQRVKDFESKYGNMAV